MVECHAPIVLWRNALVDELDQIARQEGIACVIIGACRSCSRVLWLGRKFAIEILLGLVLADEVVPQPVREAAWRLRGFVLGAVEFCHHGIDHAVDIGQMRPGLRQRVAGDGDVALGTAIAFDLHSGAGKLLLAVHLGAGAVTDNAQARARWRHFGVAGRAIDDRHRFRGDRSRCRVADTCRCRTQQYRCLRG